MNASRIVTEADRRVWQALTLWGVFIVLNVFINGTLPFALGVDMRGWTYSITKDILAHVIVYAGLFLVAPLILTKGWAIVRQPAFIIPLLLAVTAISLRPFARASVVLVVAVLAYLHWRFDLSELGFRSRGWKGDVVAILFLGVFVALPQFLRSSPDLSKSNQAFLAGLDRLFANPASTVENMFYFGFLAERLSPKTGAWLTPLLVGLMYTAHEMSNPEYWYEGVYFAMIFIGVTLITAVYLWRRNVVAIWLGDGLARFLSRLL